MDQAQIDQVVADAASWSPSDCTYSKEHEWARVVGEGIVWVGITDYAASELGDVVFVQLPAVGSVVKQFEKFGEVESVKAVSDLFSPISGEIIAVNETVQMQPELVNQSPFGQGWMLGVQASSPSELDSLMAHRAYAEYIQGLGSAH